MQHHTRSGRTLLTVTGLITAIVAGFFIVHITLNRTPQASARALLIQEPVTPGDVEQTLFRIGIRPERLAAAGVNSATVTSMVSAVETFLQTTLADIQEADNTLMLKRNQHDTLSRIVQSGLASSEQLQEFTQAKVELALAQTDLANTLALVRDEAYEHLSFSEESLIEAMDSNAQWHVPVEYCTASRTQEDWVTLREALANERIAPRYGDEPNTELQTLLTGIRGDSSYLNASTNLSIRLSGVQAAWDDALADVES